MEDLGLVHVGQFFVPAMQVVADLIVVQSEQVEQGGVQIGDLDSIFHGMIPQLVGSSIRLSAPGAAACQPDAEGDRGRFRPG